MAHSPGMTLLHYVGNFQPRKVAPLATILDQHLTVHASSGSSNFGFVEFTEFSEKMQIGTTQRFRFKALFNSARFLGGLSLHLNHLIVSRTANYDLPFGTLPFRLFGSNLDTRDLETYPRMYSGHF